MTFIPGAMKSHRQQVAITLSGTSATATLSTAVDPTCSLLGFQGMASSDTTTQVGWDDFAIGAITNSTTVTASKPGTGAWALVWYGVVYEFLKLFTLRAECGTITIPDGVASVDFAITYAPNAHVLCTGWNNANSVPSSAPSPLTAVMPAVFQLDDTHLRAVRGGTAVAGTTVKVGYSLWAPRT